MTPTFCSFVIKRHILSIWHRCNRHLLRQLPRSGWSVGRAGLGAKATYPAQAAPRENNAVGIGLFPLNTLLDEEWVQRSPRRPIILPNVLVTSPLPICQITPTTNHHPHTNQPTEKDQHLRCCVVKRLVMMGQDAFASNPALPKDLSLNGNWHHIPHIYISSYELLVVSNA